MSGGNQNFSDTSLLQSVNLDWDLVHYWHKGSQEKCWVPDMFVGLSHASGG